jgi:hypothetical protein
MSAKPINWRNLLTLVSVTILVGVEFAATGWAAGWALGGMFQLSPLVSRATEGLFVLLGLVALYYFVRAAHRAEPIRS